MRGMKAMVWGGVAGLVVASAAWAGNVHRDVQLFVEDGRIVTGAVLFDQPGQPIEPGERVFTATLGEQNIPGFTDDPGFNAASGTFPGSNTRIGFRLRDAVRVWDPVEMDFETLAPDRMQVLLSGGFAETPVNEGVCVEGFEFALASGGGIHEHVNYFLDGPRAPGVYVVTLEVTADAPGVAPSLPIFVLFAEGSAGSAQLDDAEAAMGALLTPVACEGDVDGNGAVDVNDVTYVVGRLGTVGDDGDADGSGVVDVNDITFVVGRLGLACGGGGEVESPFVALGPCP